MTESNPFKLFVVHEFVESEDYLRVFEYLESRDRFFYANCSHPNRKPDPPEKEAIQEELRNQIRQAEVVICPAGVYQDPAVISFQLIVAQAFSLPVLAINSFGGTMAMPPALQAAATVSVDWNEREITDAIRQAARGEDTATWDVIDFDPEDFT
jgi:hypothetical protein